MTDLLSFLREQYAELGSFNYEFRIRQERDWPKTLDYWFGSDRWRESKSQFELIGVDGTGGLYCSWSYPNMTSSCPPIVFLGSEGEGVSVIVSDASELVEVLAQGYYWFGASGKFEKSESQLDPLVFPEFQTRAKEVLGPDLRNPCELNAKALKLHPNFKVWVDSQAG